MFATLAARRMIGPTRHQGDHRVRVPHLWLRQLDRTDAPVLQALLEADPSYARRVTGADPGPDAATDLLTAGPPGLVAEGKVVLGAFDGRGRLSAIVDVLRGWPDPTTAHIGLLQTHAAHRQQGVGRRTHDLLLEWLRRWPEVRRTRATIVATNANHADPFWSALGYRPSTPPFPYQAGSAATMATAWTRDLSGPGSAPAAR